eukprot:CAMPEP_0183306340 /NCGR_PEP_ID=MMETSP0160_2-20130417/10788_1 /TAXON_ID=2839 ORGANISM="Odontella Sinensis, Strain Grunow 1884" /NCGR_SAMPLE_ID=MMETSP0160_2 /ASSEMBLY_ACC=CAM_ASM_000250 /LENGTH=355 /DNA_ID=CAMNT_0025469691 /DNA_START=154 /DNA_END=1218 /DNA_ORIENTATION=-
MSARVLSFFLAFHPVAKTCRGFQVSLPGLGPKPRHVQNEGRDWRNGYSGANIFYRTGLFNSENDGEPEFEKISSPISFTAENNDKYKEKEAWGIQNSSHEENFEAQRYWFNARIHTLGNTGPGGGLHAAVSPLATLVIDKVAYKGVNVRKMVSKKLSEQVHKSGAHILDLCCGVGMSTQALQDAFVDADEIVGVDTSPEMIEMAKAVSRHGQFVRSLMSALVIAVKKNSRGILKMMFGAYATAVQSCKAAFVQENAEHTRFPDQSFDLVTIMYAFHEAPLEGRERILNEGHRLLKNGGTLALVDISPDYQPGFSMLLGEPYVLEYLEHIDLQMRNVPGFTDSSYETVVPGHVGMW